MNILVQQRQTQRIDLAAREEQSKDCCIVALLVAKADRIGISIGNDSQLED